MICAPKKHRPAQQVAVLNCYTKSIIITSLGRRLNYWTDPPYSTSQETGLLDYWTDPPYSTSQETGLLDYWTDPPYSTSQVPAVSWPVELCSHKRQYWRSSCQQCRDMPLQRKKNRKHQKMCIYILANTMLGSSSPLCTLTK